MKKWIMGSLAILLGVMSIAFSCIEIVSFKGYLDSTQSEFFSLIRAYG